MPTDRRCSTCGGILSFVAVEADGDTSYRCERCGDEWFSSTIGEPANAVTPPS